MAQLVTVLDHVASVQIPDSGLTTQERYIITKDGSSIMKEDDTNKKESSDNSVKKEFSYGFGTMSIILISTVDSVQATVSACYGPCGYGPTT